MRISITNLSLSLGLIHPMKNSDWDSFYIDIADHRLHITRTGKGSGKPVLLMLHGHTDHGRSWTTLARDFQADYDCIMPDMVGHGQSSRLNGSRTLNTMVAEISSLLYMLALDDVRVIGHSMGAQLAAMLAAAIPDKIKAIVLEDPPWFVGEARDILNPQSERVQQWVRDLQRYQGMPHGQLVAERRPEVSWDETNLAMWAEARQQADLQLFGGLQWHALLEWQAMLARISCPIMLITGGAPGRIIDQPTLERALAIAPAIESRHFPQADHHINRGNHVQYGKIVATWLREIDQSEHL